MGSRPQRIVRRFSPVVPSRVPIEGEQKDPIRADEATAHAIRSAGNHHRRLAGPGRRQNLHAVVEAHHRACLLVGERCLLDRVEERPLAGQLQLHHPLVGLRRELLQADLDEGSGLCLIGADGRLGTCVADARGQPWRWTRPLEVVDDLRRKPPLF